MAFFPYTGRTHQLRVHAAHPLGLGAPKYSGGTWKMTLPRTTSRASPLVAKLLATLVPLGRAMSWQASTATVVAFSLGFVLLAIGLFEKRDLASE